MKTIALLCLLAASAFGVTLEWDRNPETNVMGYRVYVGTASRNYVTNYMTTNTMLTITNSSLPFGTNYFAVTAFDEIGLESDFSDEVYWVKKLSKPTGFHMLDVVAALESAPNAAGPWGVESEFARLQIPTSGMRFYRAKLSIGSDSNVVLVASPPKPTTTLRFDGSKTGKL